MKNNTIKIIISIYFIITLVIAGFLLSTVIQTGANINESKEELEEIYREYEVVRDELKRLNNEEYMKVLSEAFTPTQLLSIKERYTDYALQINGRAIDPDRSIIEIGSNNLKLSFYEKFNPEIYNLFPERFIHEVSLFSDTDYREMEKINSFINIYTNQATYVESSEILLSGEGIMKHYYFENIQPGEIITLDIQYQLAQKMGLDDGTLEIFYSRTD